MNTTVAVLALLGALNPTRRAVEAGRRPAAVAATGAAIALAVYLAFAGVADRLLEELDISGPNARIGAAAVVALRAGIELAVPARRETLAGKGAVVPVAFPILARPDVAVLGLAVAAEAGMAPVAGVCLGGLLLAATLMVRRVEHPALQWVGTAMSVVAALAAVDILVDAVLDV